MKKFIIAGLLIAPSLAFAQLGNVENILDSVSNLVKLALPMVKFIFAAGDEAAKDQGKRIMLWGIIALFVMIAVWGLVGFLADALGIDPQQEPDVVPTVPGL